MTSERLKELLRYDPLTGIFTWRINTVNTRIGDVAGSRDPNDYVKIRFRRVNYKAHHLAWLYYYGVFPKDEMDHRNGDKRDNSIANLREATRSQNQANKKKWRDGLKGCWLNKKTKRWQAGLISNGIRRHLGYFGTEQEAHEAYVRAAQEMHGEFARAR